MGKSEHKLTENDSWCTPPEVLDPIYEHFGGIGLDPFADPGGVVEAKTYITLHGEAMAERVTDLGCAGHIIHGNALDHNWQNRGLVFGNGPFSICKEWVPKAYREAQAGAEVILLLPVRTGALYWQDFVSRADAIIFWRGRMKFIGAKHPAPFHCALVYWGKRVETFAQAYPDHWIVTK